MVVFIATQVMEEPWNLFKGFLYDFVKCTYYWIQYPNMSTIEFGFFLQDQDPDKKGPDPDPALVKLNDEKD